MKRILSLSFAICLFSSAFSQNKEVSKIIFELMTEQEKAWNKGSIDEFMIPYWHSDSLKFIGKSGIHYGWQKTLDNYKKAYPTKEAMGILTFKLISIDAINEENTYVIGSWHLKREKDELNGYYTLLWKKIDGKWVIVSDHSS